MLDYREVKLENLRVAFWTKYEPAETTKETRETVEKAAADMQMIGRGTSRKNARRTGTRFMVFQVVYDQEIATFEDVLKEFGVDVPTSVDRAAIACQEACG